MAEAKFIADANDLRVAYEAVVSELGATFAVLDTRPESWDPIVDEPWKLPQVSAHYLTFFVLKDRIDLARRISQEDGVVYVSFAPKEGSPCVMLDTGGLWEKHGETKWVMGSIRCSNRDPEEKQFFNQVKTRLLREFTVGSYDFVPRIFIGPSAADSVKVPLATW